MLKRGQDCPPSYQRYNQTILMITHNPDAAAAASRVIRMKDGRLVNSGSE